MTDAWLSQLQAFFGTRVRELASCDDEFAINGYKAPHLHSYWTERVQQRMLNDVLLKLEPSSQRQILDVGCGTGMFLRHIAPHVAHITGVDFSEQMLTIARRNTPPNASLLQENAAALSFEDGCFDRVLCYFVINNFLDDSFVRSVLRELVRVTRGGGFVLLGNIPDYDKRDEQAATAALANRQLQKKLLLSRVIRRSNNFWNRRFHRVRPSLGNRFYKKDFFTSFAQEASCDAEILPMNIEGFIYAPFRFDVRLRPLHR